MEIDKRPGRCAMVPSLMDLAQRYLTKDDGKPADATAQATALTAKWAGRGVRGRPWTNVRTLAKQHSPEAMAKLVELLDCDNPRVRFGAAKVVLERGLGKEPMTHKHMSGTDKARDDGVQVRIMRFNEEQESGTAIRHGKLPVVPGRRKRPRNVGDGDSA